ncbi:glycosyltransferase [Foetidibacter luteolus]|uniref:glycosyltransferase n=1 Tax=Foetidibacter luteolus TaxID=2608880 RepID=UPI0021D185CB|nr:glycosyltransferase [Foetidibacter luteolus]
MVICSHNGAARMPATLKHLAEQEVSENMPWEVVLVDNASDDNTGDIASEIWNTLKTNTDLKVVKEPAAGLSFARKKGIATARYNVIVYCDDDNWLSKDYLNNVYEHMICHPGTGILGGQSDAYFEKDKPFWFDEFALNYVVGKPLAASGNANSRKYIAGAGMAVRKQIYTQLDEVFFESQLVGRKGRNLSAGDDSEICLLALFMGYDLYYEEKLKFVHYMPQQRLSWKYCVEMVSKGFAIPQLYFYMYDYCYNCVLKKTKPQFEYAYRRNIRKPAKEIAISVRKFGDMVGMVKQLTSLQAGSKKQLETRGRFNKLLYALLNRKKLKSSFSHISRLITALADNGSITLNKASFPGKADNNIAAQPGYIV